MALSKILLVDDERDNIDALKRLLRKSFEIHSALSGEEGLKILQEVPNLEVVISDQRMPGMQGSDFLEHAREMQPFATRILLTGFSDIEAVVEAVNRGQIWHYISKPWEPDDLQVTVRQASERSRLQYSLNQSRRELERALNELRAKDWSRERLLQLLLHEFRTAPQILEGLRELDPGGEDKDTRLRFISSLEDRFKIIETDISELLAEEKRIASLPKKSLHISSVLKKLEPEWGREIKLLGSGTEAPILAHEETLLSAFRHYQKLLAQNSGAKAVDVSLDWASGPSPIDLYLSFTIQDEKPLLPHALASEKQEAPVAWAALFEPFVGSEDFARHSKGLRIETARVVRHVAALGGRSEFQFSGQGRKVELLVVFKSSES